jgi:hypothetical protein
MESKSGSRLSGDKKKIGILTYHYIKNNGAALFATSLCLALREQLPEFDIGLVNYQSREIRIYELLKLGKVYRKAPLFNIRRYMKFKKFWARELYIDSDSPLVTNEQNMIDRLSREEYVAVITGMDVWNICDIRSLPKFPNIYWLPEPIRAKKIAYAASGYRSKDTMVKREMGRVKGLLNSFDLVGVRDEYTRDFVDVAAVDRGIAVEMVPDPTFLYEIKETGVGKVLRRKGIDLSKPILGILVFGKDEFSRQIRSYYKAKGFQIVALSMYNPFADVNLGHILDPHEWAGVFRYFTFCITDRFHGAIFCLKNSIPFVTIEPDPLPSLRQSKIHALLKEFELLDCYADVFQEGFAMRDFFEKGERLMNSWESKYLSGLVEKLGVVKERNLQYIQQIKKVIEG